MEVSEKDRELTILLVEDDEVDAEAILRGFQRSRVECRILLARDGVEALAMLRNGISKLYPPGSPFVILLDLNLPRMNGIEFLRALRVDDTLKRHLVFVLTTSDREEDVKAAYDAHVAGYLLKSGRGAHMTTVVELMDVYVRAVMFPPK